MNFTKKIMIWKICHILRQKINLFVSNEYFNIETLIFKQKSERKTENVFIVVENRFQYDFEAMQSPVQSKLYYIRLYVM